MLLTNSRFPSRTTTLIVCLHLLFQFLLVDSYQHSNEKLFRSTVTVKATGDALAANEKKLNLAQLFKDSYANLLQPICSFRSLEDVSLIDIIEEDDSVFDLNFVMIVKCYDCSSNTQLFLDDTSTGRKDRMLQADNGCFWNNHNSDKVGDNQIATIAPFKDDFMEEYIKLISENNIDSVRNILTINEDTITKTSEEPISCPCSQKSFCAYTNNYVNDFHPISEGLYFNCTCREGFTGDDGWRCEKINECEDEENWPCAPKEEGGYCVDKDPDDEETPMYKCGCVPPNFVEDTNYTIGVNGAKHCLSLISDEVIEIEEAEDRTNDGNSEIFDIQFSFTCENENTFPGITSIDVTGDPDAILSDVEKLERSVQVAYEKALPSECAFRSLENVTILGLLLENGREISLSSSNSSLSNRFLQGQETNNAFGFDFTALDQNEAGSNTTELNATDGLLTFDDDDGTELSLNLDFNFSIFFSMIMRCFGCPEDAQLFDDASRRGLRGRSLQEDEGSCTCQLDNGTVVEDATANQIVAPSINDFVVEFRETIVEEKVVSIVETITVEDETDNADEIPFEPIFEQPISQIRDELPSDRIGCPNECNPDNQYCDPDMLKCVCKEGYMQPAGVGSSCFDIDECRFENDCDRNAECTNMVGGYQCTCKSGFSGDGFICEDINECLSVNACTGIGEICVNTRGSFRCVTAEPTLKPTQRPTRSPPTPNPYVPTTTPPAALPYTNTLIPSPAPTPIPTPAPTPKPTPCPTPKPTPKPTSGYG